MDLSKSDVTSITTNHANDYEKVKKKKIVSLRLRLVRVKEFLKNIPFFGNTIF